MGECRVLGAIRAFDADGRELTLVSEPQRRLLAMLCCHTGGVVRSAALEESLALSAGALRTSISRLRRVLGPEVLRTGPAGYELSADVDVVDYEGLVGEAADADAESARRALEHARSLWRGPPYDEFAHEQWAEVEVRRLGDLHATAMEDLVVLLLDAGEEAAAIAVLTPLIDEHPYRDRSTRPAHAGAEPGRTHHRGAAHVPGLPAHAARRRRDRTVGGARRTRPRHRRRPRPAVVARPRPPGVDVTAATRTDRRLQRAGHGLPTPLSSFVGRARETADVTALLREHRIVTLTGAGGSGKSRLALRVASALDRSRDDRAVAWWVDLGVLAAGADVAEHVAAGIGVAPR